MVDYYSLWPRRSGILMHVSSLPGPYGIGDLGENAYKFVDWLAEAKQTIWNILPLNPTGYGDSPYSGLSVFAGNPLFISLDKLREQGWLTDMDFEGQPAFSDTRVMYGEVIGFHTSMLEKAFAGFKRLESQQTKGIFQDWCEEKSYWLNDYALFRTLKEVNGWSAFPSWPSKERRHDAATLNKFQKSHQDLVDFHKFQQWLFFNQWKALKEYANSKSIQILGDIPIYSGYDCSDVWANQHLFFLDKKSNLTVVAGLPPDLFSSTGSMWGNPIYNWNVHKESGFSWWIKRMKAAFEFFDISRIDHFRGFAGYFEIPANHTTAEFGRWVEGPGQAFFDAIFSALPDIKLVAEDLGLITPDVIQLLNDNDLPGMSVLQFAWSGDDNPFLPHNDNWHRVVYVGTHDNDTIKGWWESAPQNEREYFKNYTSFIEETDSLNWVFFRLAMMSISHTCIIPMQDVFDLGWEARMNYPSRLGGNWEWRLSGNYLNEPVKDKLREYTLMYNRYPC